MGIDFKVDARNISSYKDLKINLRMIALVNNCDQSNADESGSLVFCFDKATDSMEPTTLQNCLKTIFGASVELIEMDISISDEEMERFQALIRQTVDKSDMEKCSFVIGVSDKMAHKTFFNEELGFEPETVIFCSAKNMQQKLDQLSIK